MLQRNAGFAVVFETDTSARWAKPQSHETWRGPCASLGCGVVVAAAVVRKGRGRRAQRGRLGNKGGRFEAKDLAFERNTPSAGWSSLVVTTTVPDVAEAEEGGRVSFGT